MSDPRLDTQRIPLVRGDTGPQVQLTLTDAVDGAVVDLTGATVTLYMRAVDSTTVVLTRTLVVPVETAAAGQAIVAWQPGDLDLPEADYEGEIKVLLSSGILQTVYEVLKFRLRDDF